MRASTISQKVLLNNVFYLLPIFVLIGLLIASFRKDINFARKEIIGTKYISTIINIHGALISDSTINNISENKKLLKTIWSSETILNTSDNRLKDKGKTNLQNSNIGTFFDKEKNANDLDYINDLESFIGDESNLILDPDLDTYYLMDGVVYGVPQLLNRLNDLKSILIKKGTIGEDDIKKIYVINELLKSVDFPKITSDIDSSLKEDKNFQDVFEPLQKTGTEDLTKLNQMQKNISTMLDEVIKKKSPEEKDIKIINDAVTEISSIGVTGNQILSEMLASRITSINNKMYTYLFVGGVAVLVALLASFLIVRRIKISLAKILGLLTDTAEDVSFGSSTGNSISQQLSSSVTEQVASIQQISATTEQITNMALKTNDHVKSTKTKSGDNLVNSSESENLVKELISEVDLLKKCNEKIETRSNENSKNFESIITIMKTIEDKTKVINDIVFQTKLLSFNASVEAARAGEQGKGFAVVAEEVGNLAQLSGKASLEINELLEKSLNQVRNLTEEADKEIKKVIFDSTDKIKKLSSNVEAIKDINESMNLNTININEMITEVYTATDEQTRAVAEINKAIASMNVVANGNSKLSNELSSVSNVLLEKAQDLNSTMDNLKRLAGN